MSSMKEGKWFYVAVVLKIKVLYIVQSFRQRWCISFFVKHTNIKYQTKRAKDCCFVYAFIYVTVKQKDSVVWNGWCKFELFQLEDGCAMCVFSSDTFQFSTNKTVPESNLTRGKLAQKVEQIQPGMQLLLCPFILYMFFGRQWNGSSSVCVS